MSPRNRSMSWCLFTGVFLVLLSGYWWPSATMGGDGLPLLADASVNKLWHVSGGSGMMLYMGDDEDEEATPQLAINREAFESGSLRLTIESNVNAVRLSSGESELTLSAPAERRMTLTLDSASDPPRLVLDHEPVAEQQGRWVKMIEYESDEQILVSFVGATYANVRLDDTKPTPAIADPPPTVRTDPFHTGLLSRFESVAVEETQAKAGAEAGSEAGSEADPEPVMVLKPLYASIPGDFPALRIPEDRDPASVTIAARRLQDNVFNAADGGTGVLTERVQVGTRGTGPLKYPVFRSVSRPNPDGPYGLNTNHRQLVGLFERLMVEAARIDRTDEQHPEALDFVRRVLSGFTENNWTGLEAVLNASSRNALYNPQAQLGQPVVAVGKLLSKNPIAASPASTWAVELSKGSDHVLAADPVLFHATPGEKVLVGGLLVGYVEDPKFGMTPVLQNVCLVTPDHEGAERRLKREHGV